MKQPFRDRRPIPQRAVGRHAGDRREKILGSLPIGILRHRRARHSGSGGDIGEVDERVGLDAIDVGTGGPHVPHRRTMASLTDFASRVKSTMMWPFWKAIAASSQPSS
ncbi:hypothetical protein [Bradyrhizobium sp. LA2.1]|uniref:hypothetical protein n=1 Tax=Bradyrhizobium sp. LA2.1 TaxID=3156376 RepID=UPI00339876EC